MSVLIDGKKVSEKYKEEIRNKAAFYYEKYKKKPGLAVILIGDNQASNLYVNMKEKACLAVGFKSVVKRLQENVTTNDILNLIDYFNNDDTIHGILVQLPLPKHIDEKKILYAIDPKKDVDGFHPYNVGLLYIGEDTFNPCTPFGVMKLFKEYNIELKGKDAVVVGASNIVGRPMAAMLLKEFATVTICHIYTKELKRICFNADILISAAGKAKLINGSFVKKGAVVIDIGMNRDENGKLCGDVDFDEVKNLASFITPVPGGVGPMTIAMLLYNTMKSFENFLDS
jgi:methylenetetrahydrofolate dehydrogenase (NADP+)/methenyltetrahydrofolate cyclohydrolase